MTHITPTVGRVVHYIPGENDDHMAKGGGDQPLAAIVTHVWNDRMVNLVIFDANGVPYPKTSVTLVQPEDIEQPEAGFCQWMPYQVGQAEKSEAAA